MVYSLYAAISSRTNLIKDWHRARTHRSMTLLGTGPCALYLKSTPVVFLNNATWPKKKRKEFSHGRRTFDTTSRTPSSRKRRFSPRTMGELTKNILRQRHKKGNIAHVHQLLPGSISTVGIDDDVGIGVIPQTFAHFFAVAEGPLAELEGRRRMGLTRPIRALLRSNSSTVLCRKDV